MVDATLKQLAKNKMMMAAKPGIARGAAIEPAHLAQDAARRLGLMSFHGILPAWVHELAREVVAELSGQELSRKVASDPPDTDAPVVKLDETVSLLPGTADRLKANAEAD